MLLAETQQGLQNMLNAYENYCATWKLKVNTSKSEIVVFAKGRQANYVLHFNNQSLEIVADSKYLGILFSRSSSFYKK